MPRAVFFITQQFDPADPVLATVVPQLGAVAARTDDLIVVADRINREVLPANARAYSFHSRFKVLRGVKLLAAVVRELPNLRNDGVVVAHMCPVYAIIVSPVVRMAGVPLLMWHSHWKQDLVVRTSERVVSRVVSVDRSSFAFPDSAKLVVTGQGIDVWRFGPRRAAFQSRPLRVLMVGRYSAAKGIHTVLRAVELAVERGVDVRLDVHGPALGEEAREFRASLEPLAGARVRFHDAVPRDELPALFETADLFVNNAPGGADRVVYEAAASGLPVLASNRAHLNLLDPDAFFRRDDADGLAHLLARAAERPPEESAALGARLRERVQERHSVDSWAEGLLAAAT